MKAWVVYDYDDCAFLLHAETSGKAKSILQAIHPACDRPEFIDLRTRRLHELDNTPITYDNAIVAAFRYWDNETGEYLDEVEFTNYCNCEICKAKGE